ncbi:unnamed protein product, partial [Cyprideis torosa]
MDEVTIVRIGKDFKDWDALAAFNTGKADFEEAQRVAKEQAEAAAKAEMTALLAKYPDAKSTESGLMYVIDEVGSGPKPEDGQQITVHYAGYLADGSLFDTSIKTLAEETGTYNEQREPYDPMPMEYGPAARMIPGFKEGVSLFNIGGKGTIIIPPTLGYGKR